MGKYSHVTLFNILQGETKTYCLNLMVY